MQQLLLGIGDGEWFDQFGPVNGTPLVNVHSLFMPQPLQHIALHTLPFFVVAASQSIEESGVWDLSNARLIMQFKGEETAVEVIKQLWWGAFDSETFQLLNVQCAESSSPGYAKITFASRQGGFMLPCETLKACVQIAATRRIFDALHDPTGTPVILKWQSQTLGKGKCDPQTNVEVLLALLDVIFNPFLGKQQVRLICNGKVWYHVKLEELMRPSNDSSIVLCIQFGCAGGAGTKTQLRAHVKLLQHSLNRVFHFNGWQTQWNNSLQRKEPSIFHRLLDRHELNNCSKHVGAVPLSFQTELSMRLPKLVRTVFS